jgi:hypothetical protein
MIVARGTMGLVYEWAKQYLEFSNMLQPTLVFLLDCFQRYERLRLLALKTLCELSLYLKV